MNQRTARRLRRRLSLLIRRLASHQAAIALALALVSIGGRVLLLRSVPIPEPAVQDEFSYLLAGDTFASGRLTSPQHPLWDHLETVHEIMRPTYQSKFPPAQGLVLAVGQTVFGNPWFGVLLSMGALNAAIYWALSGWLPPRWALLGGLLALTRVGFLSYWSESYWGGAVAAAAGALVIGAVPRLRVNSNFRTTMILGIGLAILANSRPYEGLLLGVVCLGGILTKVRPGKVVLPLSVVLIPTFLWMGYYNYRVAGDALLLPYQLHERQYSTSSLFVWDTHFRPAPHYNHEALRAAWIDWAQGQRVYEHAHPWILKLGTTMILGRFFVGIPLACCLVLSFIPVFVYQRKLRIAMILAALYLVSLGTETIILPHYAAPGTAFAFILAAGSLRRLWHWAPWLTWIGIAAILCFNCLDWAAPRHRWLFDKRDFIARRASVLQKLDQSPGNLLVLVEYGPGHDVNHEWVYNRADIDRSRIVWAREMGAEKDRELINYFPDRQVWRLVDHGKGWLELSESQPRERPSRPF